jgi:hypothetical protein
MKTANVKNKTAKVKVKIFGQEIEKFGITSDDKTVTSDVIADYINTQRGDEEVGIVAKEITDCLGRKVVGILIEDFDDKGKFLRELLEIAIIIAETPELEENAKRLKRCVRSLLPRVYYPETNRLSPKEQRKYCGLTTCMSVLEVLISQSMIDDGIMTFSAEI